MDTFNMLMDGFGTALTTVSQISVLREGCAGSG